jgi:hypothetical protein
MPSFGEFLGKSGEAAWQLFIWQVGAQVVTQVLGPYLTELGYLVNEAHPDVVLPLGSLVDGMVKGHISVESARGDAKKLGIDGARFDQLVESARPKLSPADLAQLVVRAGMTKAQAEAEAKASGVDAGRFDELIKIAADAPGPADLAEALRRGIITEDSPGPGTVSFLQGIREGRLGTQWAPMLKALAVHWPTPSDALDALLEGQVSEAEGRELYQKLGGDLQFFTWLFNSRGNAPTPVESLDMLNKGLIPESGTGPDATTYQQAFLEGPWRNKWLEPFKGLRWYVIPPRTVTAMYKEGSLTRAQSATELRKSGVRPEHIDAYLFSGDQQASAPSRDLTQSAVIDLYTARIIAQADAHTLLTTLGYTADNATYLLELADLRRSIAAVNTAVARVHTLYVGHKIQRDNAHSVLSALGVPGEQINEVLHTWDLEESVNVRQLTESQIVQAWVRTVIDQDEAEAELRAIGYTAYDAWVLLSIANKQPLPGKPPPGPNPVGVIP